MLLRGCMLRNTEHVYGIVIYTGHESKVCSILHNGSSELKIVCQLLHLHHCTCSRL